MSLPELPKLNFPDYKFRVKLSEQGQSSKIFDLIRRKFVALTPEEWVRQHILHYLILECGIPGSLCAVEAPFKLNGLPKRADVLVYNKKMQPYIVAECKAPRIPIDQDVFDQAARYATGLGSKYIIVSNGFQTYQAFLDYELKKYRFIERLPAWQDENKT